MKKLGLAGAAFIGLMAFSTAANAQLCALGLIGAAIITSATEKRELTSKEAMFCGLYHETQAPAEKKRAKPAKVAKKKMG